MKKSIKFHQSELGVTGEPSPNIELTQRLSEIIQNEFQHTHGEASEHDACLFVSMVRAGKTIDEEVGGFILQQSSKGSCTLNVLIRSYLEQCPDIEFMMFCEAMRLAIPKRLDNGKKKF